MKTYELLISESVSEENRVIIEKYWELEDGKFVYRPGELRETYDITLYQLNTLIAENSLCRITLGKCHDCGNDILEEVTAQSSFKKMSLGKPAKCEHCERVYRELIEEEWDDTREELSTGMGGKLVDIKKLGRLKKLNAEELHVLSRL